MAVPKRSMGEGMTEDEGMRVERVEYEPPPQPPKKRKAPTESQVIMGCCEWLEDTSSDDMPEMAEIQRVRVLVSDRNLTLAWQYMIPLVEGRRGSSIVTG